MSEPVDACVAALRAYFAEQHSGAALYYDAKHDLVDGYLRVAEIARVVLAAAASPTTAMEWAAAGEVGVSPDDAAVTLTIVTPAKLERLLDMWALGVNSADIAREFGLVNGASVQKIVRDARKLGDKRASRRSPGGNRP
jgi:hypothetical protein